MTDKNVGDVDRHAVLIMNQEADQQGDVCHRVEFLGYPVVTRDAGDLPDRLTAIITDAASLAAHGAALPPDTPILLLRDSEQAAAPARAAAQGPVWLVEQPVRRAQSLTR